MQRCGTHRVGRLFGPVMVLWFVVLAVAGRAADHRGTRHPAGAVADATSSSFVADHPYTAFIAMGAVVLAITGAEALYADMGHFGRRPIRRAWFAVVFPALTLNYLGQGALILRRPDGDREPVLPAGPALGADRRWWCWRPLATVIASQAVISGAFSVSRQAVRLGFLPHLTVRHTSTQRERADLRAGRQLAAVRAACWC